MPKESVCEKCAGTGWIIVERASVSAAEPCGFRRLGRAERLEARSQIPPLYRNASFENFSKRRDDYNYRELAKVLVDVKGYARDFPNESRPGLLLIGDPGTGKTHLAVAAL